MKRMAMKAILWLLLGGWAAAQATGGCHAVSLSGSGTRSGEDWNNSCAGFTGMCAPDALVRGDRYYVAAGADYPPVTFASAGSGALRIAILRATRGAHCTEVGWNDGFDGEVRWTPPVIFASSGWVFDGITGADAGRVAYGFRLVSNQSITPFLRVERQAPHPPREIAVRHVEVDGVDCCGIEDTAIGVAAFYYPGDCTQGLVTGGIELSHVYFHDLKRDPILVYGVEQLLIDHAYLARNRSTRQNHGQGIALTGAHGVTIRNSVFEDIAGTAEITFIGYCPSSDVQVYGNRFFYTETWPQAAGQKGVSYLFEAIGPRGSVSDLEFYQNTIHHFERPFALNAGFYPDAAGVRYRVFNNLWVDNTALLSAVEINGSVHDYNSILNTPLAFNWKRNVHEDVEGVPPGGARLFLDPQFHLARHTAPGIALPLPYSIDPEGQPRGFADGASTQPSLWDRGAFQLHPSGAADGTKETPLP